MEVTASTLIAACADTIRAIPEYSGEYIYSEVQTQQLERPCFFVSQVTLPQEKLMNNRYRRTYLVQVAYLPKLSEQLPDLKCRQVGEALLAAFREISLPERFIRPTDLTSEVVAGTVTKELRFTFSVTMHVLWPKPKGQYLQKLIETGQVREDERSD